MIQYDITPYIAFINHITETIYHYDSVRHYTLQGISSREEIRSEIIILTPQFMQTIYVNDLYTHFKVVYGNWPN